jgi:hypothetical protein
MTAIATVLRSLFSVSACRLRLAQEKRRRNRRMIVARADSSRAKFRGTL